MYEFIEGSVWKNHPHIVLQSGGTGFYIHISLHTYSGLPEKAVNAGYIFMK
jgi:Holliday junction resolvasome RuvABC DNA-binding subunit